MTGWGSCTKEAQCTAAGCSPLSSSAWSVCPFSFLPSLSFRFAFSSSSPSIFSSTLLTLLHLSSRVSFAFASLSFSLSYLVFLYSPSPCLLLLPPPPSSFLPSLAWIGTKPPALNHLVHLSILYHSLSVSQFTVIISTFPFSSLPASVIISQGGRRHSKKGFQRAAMISLISDDPCHQSRTPLIALSVSYRIIN